jgi:hypothetical protein
VILDMVARKRLEVELLEMAALEVLVQVDRTQLGHYFIMEAGMVAEAEM